MESKIQLGLRHTDECNGTRDEPSALTDAMLTIAADATGDYFPHASNECYACHRQSASHANAAWKIIT